MSAPSTHQVVVDRDRVTKTYRDWSRGEHLREAAALVHLAEHAPGLAPRLLDADLAADPPSLVMTRLDGIPIERRVAGDLLVPAARPGRTCGGSQPARHLRAPGRATRRSAPTTDACGRP